MAYLEPETLTCPSCTHSSDIVWVIGEGPQTKPGQGPDYVDVMDMGGWIITTKSSQPTWAGSIVCPVCQANVSAAR